MKATLILVITMVIAGALSYANGMVSGDSDVNPIDRNDDGATEVESDVIWGDDSGQWAHDGECDDPRFVGPGAALILGYDGLKADASDCQELYLQGDLELREGSAPERVEWGDDSSRWADDGECDDPRFAGPAAAATVLEEDRMSDASDCRWLFKRMRIVLVTPVESDGIVWGDNSSPWANDGECDDPRFTGPGAATTLLEENLMRDANDCRILFERGAI